MGLFRNLEEIKKTQKPQEWWTELVIYKFSTPLVWLIQNTSITPNQLTLASLFLAIVASFIILLADYPLLIVAAVLLQVDFILDNADGQLARLKGTSSQFGHWLDSSCDRLKELFIITSLTHRFLKDNTYALFFGFYAIFLIFYYHGAEKQSLPFVADKEKINIEAREGPLMRKITMLRHRLKWMPFNIGEQYFLFSLFLALNRIDLFFYIFILYGTVVTAAYVLYTYYQFRLSKDRFWP